MDHEQLLMRELDEGENVLWVGKPQDSEPLIGCYKKRFTKELITSLVIAAALITGYIIGVRKNDATLYPLIIVVIAVIAALAPINCYTAPKKLRKTLYAFTDKRIAVIRDTAHTVEYGKIKEAALKTDDCGYISLLCGPDAVRLKTDRWREDALLGEHMSDSMEECESLVLFGLPKDKQLMGLISAKLPI